MFTNKSTSRSLTFTKKNVKSEVKTFLQASTEADQSRPPFCRCEIQFDSHNKQLNRSKSLTFPKIVKSEVKNLPATTKSVKNRGFLRKSYPEVWRLQKSWKVRIEPSCKRQRRLIKVGCHFVAAKSTTKPVSKSGARFQSMIRKFDAYKNREKWG